MDDGTSGALGLALLVVGLIAYFIPTFVAGFRGRDGVGMIGLLNLVIGWTVLGWVILLVVAFTGASAAERARLDEQTALLRDLKRQREP